MGLSGFASTKPHTPSKFCTFGLTFSKAARMPSHSLKRLLFALFFFVALFPLAEAQNTGRLTGRVQDEQQKPVPFANIAVLKSKPQIGTQTDAEGRYSLKLPADTTLFVQVSFVGYKATTLKISVKKNETLEINFVLKEAIKTLQAVEIEGNADRYETIEREQAGAITVDPKSLLNVPTGTGDFSQALLTVGLGVQSNTELSGGYNVRGGNFDENLVYVNGMEVYRPFLARAGQQEGLSFVNPDLVEKVHFSAGGWQAKFGDKLSSVLDVQYRRPEKLKATGAIGLLGGQIHAEAASKRLSVLAGLRHRDLRYMLGVLETQGQYLPVFTDFQNLITLKVGNLKRLDTLKNEISLLTSYARNRYQLIPESRETTFGTFDQQMRLFVAYSGQEQLQYNTFQGSLRYRRDFSKRFTSSILASWLRTQEREAINTEGAYRLCDVNTDIGSDNFNRCALVRGVGSEFKYARNALDAEIYGIRQQNEWKFAKNARLDFGFNLKQEQIWDELDEYNFIDSAGFVTLTHDLRAATRLTSERYEGYAQIHHFREFDSLSALEDYSLTGGLRVNHWSLNSATLVSPRFQFSIKPRWKRDIRFNTAFGLYAQQPFYRELRGFDGRVNRNLQPQRAVHFLTGLDWNFQSWERPFKFIAEGYYKRISDLVPYDVDNVRLRYYAQNAGIGRIIGADFRVSGEFIKGAESWFTLSLLSAQENVDIDDKGWVRRPTDQRATVTIFFQDHIPNDPTIRLYMRLIYGTGLPFGAPGNTDFRTAYTMPDYRRVDIGFSKLLVFNSSARKSLESLWIGLEVLNVLGVENVISYTWVSDFINDQRFGVPNGLTQRFLNLRLVARY